jgi:hypothetical protein
MKTIKQNSKQNAFNFNSGDMVFVFDKKISATLGMSLLVPDMFCVNYEFVACAPIGKPNAPLMATAIACYKQSESSARYIIKKLINTFNIKIVDEYKIA